jgi:hypothetical protein
MNKYKIGDLVRWDVYAVGRRYGIVIDKGSAIPSGGCDKKDKTHNFVSIAWTNGIVYKAYEDIELYNKIKVVASV